MKLLGNGSIIPLEEGDRCQKWRLIVCYDDNGKRRQKTKIVYCGKRESKVKLDEFKAELSKHILNEETFAAYTLKLNKWRKESGAYSEDTIYNDKTKRNIFNTVLGDMQMDQITAEDCRNALQQLREERGWAPATYFTYHTHLYGVFRQAVDNGMIAFNPMEKLPWPKNYSAERKSLTPDELDQLWLNIEQAPLSGLTMTIFLMIDTGMRRGETVWLKSRDVHEDFIVVSRSKTAAGDGRTIPMTDRLIKKCNEWRKTKEERGIGKSPAFCCTTTGVFIHRSNLQAWWDYNRASFGFPTLTMHEIRHSNLSKMARYMGVHELMRWAGWKDIKMAMRYVHDDLPALEAAVRRSQIQTTIIDPHNTTTPQSKIG